MLAAEYEHLGLVTPQEAAKLPLDALWRKLRSGPQRPSALCLSGGGIRSATFCLGVLQSLARTGQLQDFHYLSTVSGGGYIGSWLVNWLRIDGWDWKRVFSKLADGSPLTDPASASVASASPSAGDAPEGTSRAQADSLVAQDPVNRLRAYSNYLSPVWGLSGDSLTLAAIFLRNLLINWLVWIPLLLAIVALPRLYIGLVGAQAHDSAGVIVTLTAISAVLVVIGIAYVVADLPASAETQVNAAQPSPADVKRLRRAQKSSFAIACFTPVFAAAISFSILGAWAAEFREIRLRWFVLGGIVAHLLGIMVGLYWRVRRQQSMRGGTFVGLVLVVATGAFGGFLLGFALRYTGLPKDAEDSARMLYATLCVPAMLGAFWLAMSLYAGLAGERTTEEDREWWARATAWWLYASLAWLLVFGMMLYLPPLIFEQMGHKWSAGAQLGVGGGVLGALTSAIGYWSKNGFNLKKRTQGIIKVTGLRLLDLMAAIVVVAMVLAFSLLWSWTLERCNDWMPTVCAVDLRAEADFLRGEAARAAVLSTTSKEIAANAGEPTPNPRLGDARAYEHVMLRADWKSVALGFALAGALALIFSWVISANVFSLHGMYGNRLVRAYLGAPRARRHPHWFTGFDPQDNCSLADCLSPGRLFLVVNMALNLVKAANRRLAWQQRKASSFTATPLHCGAAGVGFVPTALYSAAAGMSLGRALTISGAAASPNMGYHSSPLVTFVMTLFNVRLGWWLPNPGIGGPKQWAKNGPTVGLGAFLDEALSRTTDDRSSVYLSDGGHFENIGIYEMVRRRCHRIVAVDATCDGSFLYSDLLDAVRKIRVDLGIPIDLPPTLPGPGRSSAHPRRIVARIRYSAQDGRPDHEDGVLIVLKPRLMPSDPPDVASYAERSKRDDSIFPHQSTADQFFDEQQFESYRLLGRVIADEALAGLLESPPLPPLDPMTPREELPVVVPDAASRRGESVPAGLAGLVYNFGTGAALATAVTVGGTLGVAGTVALKDNEIAFSPEDRALLKAGIQAHLSASELTLSSGDRDLLRAAAYRGSDDALSAAVVGLARAAHQLGKVAEELARKGSTNPPSPPGSSPQGTAGANVPLEPLTTELARLRSAIIDLTRRLSSPPAPPTRVIENSLDHLNKQVELIGTLVARDVQGTAMRKALEDIKQAIGETTAAVNRTAPPHNVRGQEGGAR